MKNKSRLLDGSEDLISWEVLTPVEQVQAFSMFLVVLLIGVAVGVGLAKVIGLKSFAAKDFSCF